MPQLPKSFIPDSKGQSTDISQTDSSKWDLRPDGTQKGNGFLGVLQRPDKTAVMSEYSIADSEKLKDAKGNYLDYPSLVPTLSKDEVNFILNHKEGQPFPQAIKNKAEAFALERQKAGKPLFAQVGEANENLYPEIPRSKITNFKEPSQEEIEKTDYPKSFTPDKVEEEETPGILSRALSSAKEGISSFMADSGKFISEHPELRRIGQEFLTGTSPEQEKMYADAGIRSAPHGEEFSVFPKINHQPETYAGGFAKSIYDDFIRPLGTASGIMGSAQPGELPAVNPQKLLTAGPRFAAGEAGIQDITAQEHNIPIRRSTEVPYRPEDSFSTAGKDLGDAFMSVAQRDAKRGRFGREPLAPEPVIKKSGVLAGPESELGIKNSPATIVSLDDTKRGVMAKFDSTTPVSIDEVKQFMPENTNVVEFGDNTFRIDSPKARGILEKSFMPSRVLSAMPKVSEALEGTANVIQNAKVDDEDNKDGELAAGKMNIPREAGGRFKAIGPAATVAEKLINNLRASIPLRGMQDKINRAERAARFSKFEGMAGETMADSSKQLSALKGEYDKVNRKALQLDEPEVDQLFSQIHNANITTPEKIRSKTALFKILNGGEVPQKNELSLLSEVFGPGFGDSIIQMHGGIGAIGTNIAKAANTMKAMSSSLDLSAPLRQGLGMIHKKEYRDAFKEMFKYMGSEDAFKGAMEGLEKRPTYLLGREAGLFLAKPGDLLKGEEAFANNYLGDVHNMGKVGQALTAPFRASERAYTGFLNKLRADVFDNLVSQSRKLGNEPYQIIDGKISPTKEAENIAKYINYTTGRGGLGKLEKVAPELNTVLWSPRLISSRLNILANPKYYMDMDKFTRKEAIKSLLAIGSAGSSMMALGALAGGKLNSNELSSDYGKVRFGNKVMDPWGGFQQYVVAAQRFLQGRNQVRPQSRFTTADRFIQNKLSPVASLVNDVLRARKFTKNGDYEDQYGENKSIPREVTKRFEPMFLQDLEETLKEDPSIPESIGLSIPALFGAGLQDYPEQKSGGFRKLR